MKAQPAKIVPMTTPRTGIDRTLLEASPFPQIVFGTDPDLTILEVNARHCALTGMSREDLLGRALFEAFPVNPNDPSATAEPELRASVARALDRDGPDEMEIVHHDMKGADGRWQVRYWQPAHSPIHARPDGTGPVIGILQTVQDVTAAELRARVMAARLRTASSRPEVAQFDYDPDANHFYDSDNLRALFGLPTHAPLTDGTPIFDRLHPEDRPPVEAEIARIMEDETALGQFEYRILLPSGDLHWVTATAQQVRDPVTQTRRLVGFVVDVTRYKRTEEELRQTLELRDLLVAEVNHRVKNSLQLVASILSIESRKQSSDEARAALKTATSRVEAVARVHASLYTGTDVRSVAMHEYLATLCAELEHSNNSPERKITVSLKADPVRLPTDKAISAALAVNEMITNAIKHAFAGRPEGRIDVLLEHDGGGEVELSVSDDGTGPATSALAPDSRASSGLGSRLMAGAAVQLGGKLEHDRSPQGWTTRLRFPI
jgi:PAS domain S-box-containing protein